MTGDEMTQLAVRLANVEHELERLARAYDGENSISPGVIGILRRHTDKFQEHDKRLVEIEQTIDRVRWTVAGAAAAGSLFGGGIVYLLAEWFADERNVSLVTQLLGA